LAGIKPAPQEPELAGKSRTFMTKISSNTVRDDFNDPIAVIHYTRAAHELGLWRSEELLIERFFQDRDAPLIEAGCGAGRVTLGLWKLGYRNLTAFDFAEELLDQARSLAAERDAASGLQAIRFVQADATAMEKCHVLRDTLFSGALFMFNGLMQIPGRENRRAALRELHRVCAPGAPLLFTTHDRDSSPTERALWRLEALRWERGEQNPQLVEFGDRYFEEAGTGRTFMHLPTRTEILDDLLATGWSHAFDAMRHEVAIESRQVLAFSDECRFWLATRQ
jgi:ubiquinone/menaquinone biosynthesis C-methylase UbiE